MRRTYLVLAVAVVMLASAGIALASSHTGSSTVSFSVATTQQLTANSVGLGSVAPGVTSTNTAPFTISSNTNWQVTAVAADDFKDSSATVSLASTAMTLGGNALPKSPSGAATIASGNATESATPSVATTLDVPWTGNLGSKSLFAVVTYTAVPN